MKLPENLNLKPLNILKFAALAVVAIIVIALAVRLIGSSFSSFNKGFSFQKGISPSYNADYGVSEEMYASDSAGYAKGGGIALSSRNISSSPIPPIDNSTSGNDAENFEVTQYSASIETRHLENDCGRIAALKGREDVIFEFANENEHSCNFNFKAAKDSTQGILDLINSMDPKNLDESAYTIKRQIDDFTSEEEILKNKMKSIDDTLAMAQSAYGGITKLAIETQNADALAKIIDSKIGIIERLTQEKISVNAELERLSRAKAEQLDRLEYTYFNVYIYENKFIDGQALKDSWKAAVQSFLYDINKVAQDLSINLIALLFIALQYLIYFFIILIIIKYAWKSAKYIWKK